MIVKKKVVLCLRLCKLCTRQNFWREFLADDAELSRRFSQKQDHLRDYLRKSANFFCEYLREIFLSCTKLCKLYI